MMAYVTAGTFKEKRKYFLGLLWNCKLLLLLILLILSFSLLNVSVYAQTKDTSTTYSNIEDLSPEELAQGPIETAKPVANESSIKITADYPDATAVTIAGEFNGWDITATPMQKDENGKWVAYLKLKPGKYEYKFVINGEWEPGSNRVMYVYKTPEGKLEWSTTAPEQKETISSTKAQPAKQKNFDPKTMVKIVYTEAPNASKVTLAGSFNNWNPDELKMWKDANNNWIYFLPIQPGTYEYKFIIDGNWMEGANLKMKVIRDPNTGNLKIARPKPTSNTPASPKVYISGDFYMHYNFISVQDTNGIYSPWEIDKPRELINLNFEVTVNDNVRAYSTLQFKAESQNYSSYVRKSAIKARINPALNLMLFYTYPFFTYQRPLNPWNDLINTRIVYSDDISFAYEPSYLSLYKIGAQMSGLFTHASIKKFKLNFIYGADLNSTEDFIYLGAQRNFHPNLDLQTVFMSYRGRHWERANSDGWFHNTAEDSGTAQSWYQAFEYESLGQIDARFPLTTAFAPYFVVRYSTTKLSSIFWNQYTGDNINLYKTWPLENKIIACLGTQSRLLQKKLSAEIAYKYSASLLKTFYQDAYKKDRVSYSALKFILRYAKKPLFVQLAYLGSFFSDFDSYRHFYYDDNEREWGLDPYNYSGIGLLNTKSVSKFQLNTQYTFRNITLSLKDKFYTYNTGDNPAPKTNDLNFNILMQGFVLDLVANLRVKTLNLMSGFNYTFVNPFIGTKIRPTKTFEVIAGYGYWPELFTDYTAYFYDGIPYEIMDYFNSGESINNMKNLYYAENSLATNHIISLIARFKF